MKTTFILITVTIIFLGFLIRTNIVAGYQYEKNYSQSWELADKSATIPAKSEYIKKFVADLEEGYSQGKFASYNAIWLKTPNNSFENNLTALKSLSIRLDEIQNMDPTSFQYNTAIQQITQQEQGEAGAMLSVFSGCYQLSNYPIIWGWIGLTLFLLSGFILLCFFMGLPIIFS